MSGRLARRLRGSSPLERDEGVIEALARRETDGDDSDDAVRLLASWCQRIDDVPAPSADPLTAVVERLPARPARSFARWAAAATLAVSGLLLGGLHAAEQARPGSTFWPLTELFDRDRARSLAAFEQVDDYLTNASTALKRGQIHNAATAVVQARAVIDDVRPEDGRPALTVRLAMLEGRISSLAGGSAAATEHPKPVSAPTPPGGTPTDTGSSDREGTSTGPTSLPSPTPTGSPSAGSGGDPGGDTGKADPPEDDHTNPSSPSSTTPTQPLSPTPTAGPADSDDDPASTAPKTRNTQPGTKHDTDGDADGNSNGNSDGNEGGTANSQGGSQRAPRRNTPRDDTGPVADG